MLQIVVALIQTSVQNRLNPGSISKFTVQMEDIPQYSKVSNGSRTFIEISAVEIESQMLPHPHPKTKMFGYKGKVQQKGKQVQVAMHPGPSIVLRQGQQVFVKVKNQLGGLDLPIDWELPDEAQKNQLIKDNTPYITHFHGAEIDPHSDGHAMAYYTRSGVHGPDYKPVLPCEKDQYVHRLNGQQGQSYLFYHDHTMGLTRLNVYNGLFGLLNILPALKTVENVEEAHLVIYDRSFNQDGSLFYQKNQQGGWVPQSFGDVIVVNGKVWPKKTVNAGLYRLHLLIASNARYFNLGFRLHNGSRINFHLIGNQQGLISAPVKLDEILLGPGMRADIIVNFSSIQGQVFLQNDAMAPYPEGQAVDQHTKSVMKFIVRGKAQNSQPKMQKVMPVARLAEGKYTQSYVFVEQTQQQVVKAMYVNGVTFHNSFDSNSFFVNLTTEIYVINLTPDAHPFHTHLVGFQAVEECDVGDQYINQFFQLNGLKMPFEHDPVFPQIRNHLENCRPAEARESGWRDTINVNPQKVMHLRLRISRMEFEEVVPFDFDPTVGNYLVHCHILEHEDKDMMQNMVVHSHNYQNIKVARTLLKDNQLTVRVQPVERQQAVDDSGVQFQYRGKKLQFTRTEVGTTVEYKVKVEQVESQFKEIEMKLKNRRVMVGAREREDSWSGLVYLAVAVVLLALSLASKRQSQTRLVESASMQTLAQ